MHKKLNRYRIYIYIHFEYKVSFFYIHFYNAYYIYFFNENLLFTFSIYNLYVIEFTFVHLNYKYFSNLLLANIKIDLFYITLNLLQYVQISSLKSILTTFYG